MQEQDPKSQSVLRRLLGYAKPHKWWLIVGILAGVVGGTSIFGALMATPDVFGSLIGDKADASTQPTALELFAVRFDVTPRADDGSMTGEFVVFITNKFLKFQFLGYGPAVIRYYSMPPEEREMYMVNPMCETFPRIAACNYHRYGSGGGGETKNAICVLGLNMINDKVRIF